MVKLILLVITVVVSSSVMADELVVNLVSKHLNSVHKFNETNLGLGYRLGNNIEIGFFRNSYYLNDANDANGSGYSLYVKGGVIEKNLNRYATVGVDLGLAFYGNDGKLPVVPIAQAILKVAVTKSSTINVGYLPKFNATYDGKGNSSQMYGLLTLSSSYRF